MARFCEVITSALKFGLICPKYGRLYSLTAQSPELPNWFKYPAGEKSQVLDSDDDFVLPIGLESYEDKPCSGKANDHKASVRITNHDIIDPNVDEISDILKDKFMFPKAVLVALNGCSVKVSKDLVDKILNRFSNDWVPAFGFFLWADAQIGYVHLPDSYDTMVDILGKAKQFDLMWGLVDEMAQLGGLVSLATMTKIMRRLAGAGRWKEAIETFRDLESFGVKKDTVSMNVLLNTLCKERSVRRARDVFLEFRSEISPNASSYNTLIHGWCKAKKLEEAQRTLEEMREFGFSPCVITYTSLIEAYCLEKNFKKVDALLDEMHVQGCPPNVVTYTIVMHALGKAKETQEALKVFGNMKREGCVPDTSSYNSLIYILSSAGQLQDANNILEEMCNNGVLSNVTTYNTLISAACAHSQEENALKLLQKMEENSCKPDIKTYTPLLKLCCKRRWTKILLFLLGHMFKKDISLDHGTYTLLVQRLCRNGKLEQSCLFFEEMVLRGFIPKHHTYTSLLETLDRMNMDTAKAKVQQLMVLVQNTKQVGNHSVNKHQIEERSMELPM